MVRKVVLPQQRSDVLTFTAGSCLDVAWIDDSRFVTCGGDEVIYVFQLNTTKPIRTLK
jgi:CO dehydrogenase/acetyl-CoA synthase gamma subunit (corrinoid Fe-S protein)